MSRTARRWSWGLLAVVVVGTLFVGSRGDTGPTTNQERVYEIAATLSCPQCTGQSVAESDAAIAREMRGAIAELIEQGYDDDEIREQIASGYEEDIRLEPAATGVTGLVWQIPLLFAAGAVVGCWLALRHWSRRGRVTATDVDRSLVDRTLADRGSARDSDVTGGGEQS